MRVLLRTDRLDVVALEAETARLARHDRAGLAAHLAADVPEAWPLDEIRDALPFFEAFAEGEAFGGLLIDRARRIVVGDAGFHGTPLLGGDAEIGYSLVPEARGRGYATEAVAALLELGWASGLNAILARVAPDNAPSHRVLSRCGFECEGQTDDWVVWRRRRGVAS